MDAILYFDTEDVVSPPEVGCDDIVLWLADELTRRGLKGCFHLTGEKARLLEQRGRHDIIAALRRHDVSSHFVDGTVHPMTVEEVAAADWDEGVRLTIAREQPGFAYFERLFGKCSALTRHGSSYAPQLARAAGLCGKLYHGVPFCPPEHHVFWFCGTLCTTQIGLIRSRGDRPGPGRLGEDQFGDDEAFERQFSRFLPALDQATREWDFTALFGCHPLRLCVAEFETNFLGGVNRVPRVPPRPHTAAHQATARRNFARYLDALANQDGLRLVGLDDLACTYGTRSATVPAGVLRAYAEQVLDEQAVPLVPCYSPAELLLALADAASARLRHGLTAVHLPTRTVIGPRHLATSTAPAADWSSDDVLTVCDALVEAAERDSMLPDTAGPTLPLSAALALLARVLLAPDRESWPTERALPPAPAVAEEAYEQTLKLANWQQFAPELSFERIAGYTVGQTWSLAGAVGRR